MSILAMADTWSGKLVDAQCYDEHKKSDSCAATTATRAFKLDASGKVFNFDEAGNAKAAEALKNRADRSADPAKPPTHVSAQITGTEKDGTITVATIEVQ
jgi:hypothetical protein